MTTPIALDQVKARPTPVGLLETLLTALVLLMVSGAFTQNGFFYFPITVIRAAGMAFAIFAMRYHITALLRTAFSDLPLLLLTGLGALSIMWSASPGVTMDQAIWLVMTTIIGIYIASAYNFQEQVRLVVYTLSLATVFSFAFTLVFPQYGVSTGVQAGRWRGIFTHKNQFSFFVSLAAIMSLYFGAVIGRLRWLVLALASLLLVLSGGATGMIAFIAHIFLVPLMRFLRAHYLLLTGLMLVGVPVLLALSGTLFVWYEEILAIFGRDGSLTGRTDLWDVSFILIEESPLLGYGIRGAFSGGTWASRAIGWGAEFAHNGWIDTALDLGIIGLALMIFSYARNVIRAIRYARRTRSMVGLYPLTFLTFSFIMLYSTSSLISMVDFFWIMYVAITLSLARVHEAEQQQRRERVQEAYRQRNERLREMMQPAG